ncbi:MAG: sulfatase-like hydrolase/transferase [Desulforhopalus sp.]|nr:sulfatase-like hydrolase/transferase [Desulforhopalus sp.]
MKTKAKSICAAALLGLLLASGAACASEKKPNIIVIWGDDIGQDNISAYHRGLMGGSTPNIDRIAKEGALFTDHYGQQSCTAGRAAFMLGQNPFRTGLLTIGMPGAKHGVRKQDPGIAELLKPYGYMTGQFGKNHLGDRNEYLPTVHGFDEFYGNLYHLNAEEEPENADYPKNPEFRKKYGPRGVLDCVATDTFDKTDEPRWGVVGKQKCKDTGPLTAKRMEDIEEDLLNRSLDFMERAVKSDKPFFLWHVSTRNHVWIHLNEKYKNKTGHGIFADGMTELDDVTGALLDKLDNLKIADNTIVIFSTDNGAEIFTWPQGGNHPWRGEKGLTNEGGFRIPQLVRWPGKIKPGTIINDIFSAEDWMPTLLAAANGGKDTDIQAKLIKGGVEADGKTFKAHLDGFNQMDLLTGNGPGKRKEIFYFSGDGDLNAIRVGDWKIIFTEMWGNLPTAWHKTPSWPLIVNLRRDPYEKFVYESSLYFKWWADRMYIMVPAQEVVAKKLESLKEFPPARGSSLSLGKIMDKIQYARPASQ